MRVILKSESPIATFTQFKSWTFMWRDIVMTIKDYLWCHRRGMLRIWVNLYPYDLPKEETLYQVSYLLQKDKGSSQVGIRIFGFKIEELEKEDLIGKEFVR